MVFFFVRCLQCGLTYGDLQLRISSTCFCSWFSSRATINMFLNPLGAVVGKSFLALSMESRFSTWRLFLLA